MNAPFKTDALPTWRLDDLYAGREDPRIAADLAEAERLNKGLAKCGLNRSIESVVRAKATRRADDMAIADAVSERAVG